MKVHQNHLNYGYDKLRMQKAATRVEGMDITEAIVAKNLSEQRPLAVVLERSGTEQADAQVRQNSALHTFLARLDKEAELPVTKEAQNSNSGLNRDDRHCRQANSSFALTRALVLP